MKREPSILYPFLIIFLLVTGCNKTEPYKNPKLSVEERVNDLVARMTLDEKISQLLDHAPAIPRLGVPEYNWWNEGLHGVARAGYATVFPQAIGLAATFSDSILSDIATAIGDEFRAKYNDFQRKGEFDRYKGLTVWSPNINIFRDPRWGRGQETYGEDPFLTSRMGVAFVKGLQGNDPKYFKTIATPKHYAVHSGPEPLRHEFDVDVSQRDLVDTYLPAFEACITEGRAYSIMSAYNRFRGLSCTGSPYLLDTILKQEWGFDGYIVSDCGAVADIFANHKIAGSEAGAAAIALKSGVDLNCGRAYHTLKEAVERGFCTEADIDVAVKRLFTARFKLGMFDPPDKVPYNKIPFEVNECPAHKRLALEAALQSIVLLKNDAQTLPLSKSIKTIAVIGPNADRPQVMYGNYNGIPSESVTPLTGIRNKVGESTEVLYSQGCSFHQDFVEKQIIPVKYLSSGNNSGLSGEYYNTADLSGNPFAVRVDSVVNFGWWNDSPMPGMNQENFSVRWTGSLLAPKTGKYEIFITGDDGYRLYIDDKLEIDAWDQGWKTKSVLLDLTGGQKHKILLEYYQESWGSYIALEWGLPKEDIESLALEAAKKSDAVVFFGGLSPELEGEEMFVDLSGFNGGDRTSIDLPEVQTNLLKKLHALGKPVILVLMNGSAVAVNWADENLPAILEAWYPGQDGGTAIADVLFGDYNPAGRLPVTFYRSADQLPPFEDYNMQGRTYRYFNGDPLYRFGHGLSYTTFRYSNLRLPTKISTTDSLVVEADITNSGSMAGDEVVQVYVRHETGDVLVPIHALQAFRRIHLESGETKTVSFVLKAKNLCVINKSGQRIVKPEILQMFVGGKQPSDEATGVLSGSVELTGEEYKIERISVK